MKLENCNLKGMDPNEFFAAEEIRKTQEEINHLNTDNYLVYAKSTETRTGILLIIKDIILLTLL